MRRAALALAGAALLPAPAAADPGEAACARTITVTGRAQAARAPDYAEVRIGVEARAASPAAALDAASKAVAGTVALARDLGVPADGIATAAVTLEPATRTVTRPDGSRDAAPDGYRATNQVGVRLADMARLGDLLRRALEAGANRIDAIGFGLDDPGAAEAALQVAAARDARTRAAAMAEAVGAGLGRLCSLAGTAPAAPAPPAPMLRAAAGPRRVPIEAGTIHTAAEVTAAFAVAP